MIRKMYILPVLIFSFISCDLLRFSPFEVISWTPGDGYHFDTENIIVSLDFSHDADIASVERHFSLTGNGGRINGTFSWNERKMIFTPLVPLEKNIEYIISLSANAHDASGLSLDNAFYCEFTTRDSKTRPVLVSSYPEMYAQVSDPRAEIRFLFSLPIPVDTLYDNVSFSPSMTGYWHLEDSGKLAVFTPVEPWAQHSRYEIQISPSLTDNKKNIVNNEYSIVFTTGVDNEAPYLLYAGRITKNKEHIELNPDKGFIHISEFPVENDGWEKEDKLSLVFSKSVDSLSVKNFLSAENAPGLVLETQPGYMNEIIFRFDNTPVFESRFTFRLKQGIKDIAGNETKNEYIYRIFADGRYSKPPTLAGIRIPMAPETAADTELVCFETESLFNNIPINNNNYPSGIMKQTWIEFYFFTAEGAFIDPFSLMELFRTETSNNVIVFSPRQVKTSGFSISVPQTGWENFQRIEIAGFLTNSINFGIINFLIAPGLKDSLGNKNDKTQKISITK
jgi:hypothetical protein